MSDGLTEAWKSIKMYNMDKSAGLLIIENNKILLCHPTNANWNGTYSIPKGMIENNESSIDAAIRETFEETGIKILKEQIYPTEYCINYKNSKGTIYKKVFYFIVNVDNLPDVLPKNQIQIEEVDWVGFLDKNDAESKIFWRFKEMLDYIKND